MNADVGIVLFILGFIIGVTSAFAITLMLAKRHKPNTEYIIVNMTKKPQNDDWKTYEKVYEREEK